MAKPVAPRGSARERVLQATLALFMEHSVGGTSMQMIADRLGLSKPAVYYQFRSRDDIVIALVEPMFDDIVVYTDPAVAAVVEAVGEFRDAFRSLQVILAGPEPDPTSRTAVAVLVSGIFGAAADPAVADIPNEELHRILLDCSRRLFAA